MRRLAAIGLLLGCVPERALVPPPPAGWSALVVVSLAREVPVRAIALDPAPADLELTLPRDDGALAALGFSAPLGELCLAAGPLEVVERGRVLPAPATIFAFAPGDDGWRSVDETPASLAELEFVDPRRDPGFAAARCGDGLVCEGLEECDDGNDDDDDGCTNTCRRVCRCGDGLTCEGLEECDDGNRVDDDGCSNACRWRAYCGDGRRDRPLEECDDGNRVDDDGCSNACSRAACRGAAVVAAHWMSFVLARDGTLYAFGSQSERSIGVGTTDDVLFPTRVEPGPWRSVSSFGLVTAAIATDGSLWTWGRAGPWLGRPHDEVSARRPGRIEHPTGFVAVATGFEHVLALDTASVAWAFGTNTRGQLGLGDREPRAAPTALTGRYRQVVAGGATSALIDLDRRLFTFGSNDGGVGAGGARGDAERPVEVPGLPAVAAVELGYHHGFLLDLDGGLYAFGDGPFGELGVGTRTGTNAPRPRRLDGGPWRAASAGDHHSLAIDARGQAFAWGSNPEPGGLVGVPIDLGGVVPAPLELGAAPPIVSVSAGWRHSLLLAADGRVHSFSLAQPEPAGRTKALDQPGRVELCP